MIITIQFAPPLWKECALHVHSTKLHKKNPISPLTPMLYMEI